MPGFSAGSAYVDLVPRLQKGWSGAVEKEVDGPLGRIRSKAGAIGKAVGIGLGVGVIGGGAALLKLGANLDDALDNIANKTGKIGPELTRVQDDFRAVAKRVPNDLGEVSDAVAALSSRTGLTGKPLQDLSTQLLTLSRITKTDLNTTIEESTRFFGDWGIKVGNQAGAMDSLFEISQKSGVGMSDLQTRLVKFGGPLRQLGFDWQTSAAMVAKFQKEGVNTDLVMGSMRIALGKMAKAGEDPQKTLARVTDEIKNAGSAGEANAKAIELFGARAGPDMAAAIREGRFEVQGLLKDVGESPNQIEKAAAATDDFGEKWGKIRNRLALALEPLASKLFDLVNKGFDKLAPLGDWLAKRLPGWAEKASHALEPVAEWVRNVGEDVGKFFAILNGTEDPDKSGVGRFAVFIRDRVLPIVREVVAWLQDHWKPVLIAVGAAFALLLAPITTVVAAIVFAYLRFGWFRDAVDAVVHWLTDTAAPAIANFAQAVQVVIAALVAWWKDHWDEIRAIVVGAVQIVARIVELAVKAILFVWTHYGDLIVNYVRAAFEFVKSIIEAALKIVRGIIDVVMGLLTGDWSRAWDGVKGILAGVWDAIGAVVKFGITSAKDAILAVMRTLGMLWAAAWDAMKSIATGIWHGLTKGMKAALNAIIAGIEKAINLAVDVINTALDGIDKAAGPWVNFGEIPHVHIGRLEHGGGARAGSLNLVGEAGPELLRMGSTGGHVFTNRELAALAGMDGDGAAGVTFARGAVQVDARGIEPLEVGDYAARQIGWRLTTRGRR